MRYAQTTLNTHINKKKKKKKDALEFRLQDPVIIMVSVVVFIIGKCRKDRCNTQKITVQIIIQNDYEKGQFESKFERLAGISGKLFLFHRNW